MPSLSKSEKISLIKEYSGLIASFFENRNKDVWLGTFLYTKDRFHSLFFQIFINFKKTGKISSPLDSFLYFLKTLSIKCLKWHYHLLRNFFFIVRAQIILSSRRKIFQGHKDLIIIKSFSFEKSFSEEGYKDLYFEDLTSHLLKRKDLVMTMIDPLNSQEEAFRSLVKEKKVFAYQIFNSVFDIFSIYFNVLFSFFSPPRGIAVIGEHNFNKVMRRQYYIDLLNPIMISGLLLSKSYSRLAKVNEIKSVFLTYENLNWEKIFINAIRKSSPKTKIVGFQHAPIMESALNYFIAEEEEVFFPKFDRIVTNGKVTKDILDTYGNFRSTEIKVGCALRQKSILNIQRSPIVKKRKLLLALEGDRQSYSCLEYLLKQVGHLEGWEILLRTHPILPVEAFPSSFQREINSSERIMISKGSSLEEDILDNFIVMYWGSTVSLESLALGRPVIHFDRGDLLSYDPAFSLKENKFTVNSESSLLEVLEKIYATNENDLEKGIDAGAKFVGDYFHKINEESLDAFII